MKDFNQWWADMAGSIEDASHIDKVNNRAGIDIETKDRIIREFMFVRFTKALQKFRQLYNTEPSTEYEGNVFAAFLLKEMLDNKGTVPPSSYKANLEFFNIMKESFKEED